jgi:hypothetical protein
MRFRGHIFSTREFYCVSCAWWAEQLSCRPANTHTGRIENGEVDWGPGVARERSDDRQQMIRRKIANKLLAAAAVAGILASSPGVRAEELTHEEVSNALYLCERYTVSCGEGSPPYPRCFSLPACRIIQHRFYTDLVKGWDDDDPQDRAAIEDVARRATETERR